MHKWINNRVFDLHLSSISSSSVVFSRLVDVVHINMISYFRDLRIAVHWIVVVTSSWRWRRCSWRIMCLCPVRCSKTLPVQHISQDFLDYFCPRVLSFFILICLSSYRFTWYISLQHLVDCVCVCLLCDAVGVILISESTWEFYDILSTSQLRPGIIQNSLRDYVWYLRCRP